MRADRLDPRFRMLSVTIVGPTAPKKTKCHGPAMVQFWPEAKPWMGLSIDDASVWAPSAWRLGFLAKKNLGYLTFLAKILAIILGKVHEICKICKIFEDH